MLRSRRKRSTRWMISCWLRRSRLASGSSSSRQLRVRQQRLGDEQALLLAARQDTDRLIGVCVGADRPQRLGHFGAFVPGRRTETPAMADQAEQHQVAATQGQIGLERLALRHIADGGVPSPRRSTQHTTPNLRWLDLTQQHAQQRGFAGAIGSDQAKERARARSRNWRAARSCDRPAQRPRPSARRPHRLTPRPRRPACAAVRGPTPLLLY